MHALTHQILQQLLMEQFDTFPSHYNDFGYLREGFYASTYFLTKWQLCELGQSFLHVLIGLGLCYDSAYTDRSTPVAAFDRSIWYFAVTI